MATSIKIAQGPANLPVRIPHLMPFHINHNGPAPISTYFPIKHTPLPSSAFEAHPSVNGRTDLATAIITTELTPEEIENDPVAAKVVISTTTTNADGIMKVSTSAPHMLRPGPIQRLSDSAKRFTSFFRGRAVHGVEIALPKDYTGIILRGVAGGKAPTTTTSKSKRWSLRGKTADEESRDCMSGMPHEQEGPVKILKPAARFDSFVLWHPDIPVDEGKDEYLRSLSEWVNIATEVHQSEPLPP
ncbi:ribonuclease H2, subunit C [Multifurca ochricompacta]|uniref:Ribonuclease H2, subunit C n=1 Tax=Multifurca ochricompacta TaxID=376703 RepID=A0AAD4LWB6_9AGAM|nr:ribonuclease H2, subunit C [Multifurca ochricompacta]